MAKIEKPKFPAQTESARARLDSAREHLDEIGEDLLQNLVDYFLVVADEVVPAKEDLGLAAYQHDRHVEKLGNVAARAVELGLDPGTVLNVFSAIQDGSVVLQNKSLAPESEG